MAKYFDYILFQYLKKQIGHQKKMVNILLKLIRELLNFEHQKLIYKWLNYVSIFSPLPPLANALNEKEEKSSKKSKK